MGMSDLLLYTDLSEDQKEMINVMKSSSMSLLEIIDDILELSKIEAGKVELKPNFLNISNFINRITKVFGTITANKNLVLLTNVEKDVPKEIFVDEIRLLQIISNLLGNAIKFTNTGKVELSVRSIKTIDNKIQMMFLISDTGIGIKEQDIPRLFNYFTQLDDSKTKQFQGTGLGLTISKNLVELMGGEICVESEYGKGSTFYFTCWVDTVSNQNIHLNTEPITTEERTKKSLRLLLVEDDYVSQLIIKRLCKMKLWNVVIASSGNEAIDIIEKEKFHLILMDVHMAEVSGYDVTKFIREKELLTREHIPIIATTAYAMAKDKDAAINAGMDDYISKPLDLEKLVGIIEDWTKQFSSAVDSF
jgi:two-component system, sensor histidine kinase